MEGCVSVRGLGGLSELELGSWVGESVKTVLLVLRYFPPVLVVALFPRQQLLWKQRARPWLFAVESADQYYAGVFDWADNGGTNLEMIYLPSKGQLHRR